MLYFKALEEGLTVLPTRDQKIRTQILTEAKKYGWEHLHTELAKVDPGSATKIHPHDTQRIERALEVYRLTGKSISAIHLENSNFVPSYAFCNLVLWPKNRDQLKNCIKQRFFKMLEDGMIDEVASFYRTQQYDENTPAFRIIGYREIWQYLSSKINFQQLCELVPLATWHLAKRQLTWLKKWPAKAEFLSVDERALTKAIDLIKNFLNFR